MSMLSFNDKIPFIVAGISVVVILAVSLVVKLYRKSSAEFMASEKRIMVCTARDILEIQLTTLDKMAKELLNELYSRAKHDLVSAAKDRVSPSIEIFLELKKSSVVSSFGDKFDSMVVDPFTDKMMSEGFTVEYYREGYKAKNIGNPAFHISCEFPAITPCAAQDSKGAGYNDEAVDA